MFICTIQCSTFIEQLIMIEKYCMNSVAHCVAAYYEIMYQQQVKLVLIL